jgi:hypothetical protein
MISSGKVNNPQRKRQRSANAVTYLSGTLCSTLNSTMDDNSDIARRWALKAALKGGPLRPRAQAVLAF